MSKQRKYNDMALMNLTQQITNTLICPSTSRRVDAYDTKTKGLLLEVRPTGGKTYYLRYVDERGRARQIKLADHRDVTLQQARNLADTKRNQIAMGLDPHEQKTTHKSVPTLDEFFADRYLPFVKGYKRSWDCDESLYRNHIRPLFGKQYMDEITKADIIAMHHERRKSGAAAASANRLVILLRYMFNLAIKWEIAGVVKNPAKDVKQFDDVNKRERYLSTQETQQLSQAVTQSDNTMLKHIVAMLILTGARKREVLDAQWEHIDLVQRRWFIPITKTGKPRYVPLSDGVLTLLQNVPRTVSSYIFANPKTRLPYVSIFYSWDTARKQAGLAQVRIHDLRHSFASFMVNNGRSLYEVQHLLGHTQIRTTQRYAHLSQETLLNASNAVSNTIARAMGLEYSPTNMVCAD